MSPIHFNSERERKIYQDGLAIVAKKLSGNRRMTPERRHQYSMAVGLATVATIKKMSDILKDGVPPAKAAPATPASTRKAYAAEAGPFQPRKLHVYSNRAWLPELP